MEDYVVLGRIGEGAHGIVMKVYNESLLNLPYSLQDRDSQNLTWKELSSCHKLWFSNPYLQPNVVYLWTMNSVSSNNLCPKYQRFTPSVQLLPMNFRIVKTIFSSYIFSFQ